MHGATFNAESRRVKSSFLKPISTPVSIFMYSNLANDTCFAPSLVKEVGMWKTCLLGLPFGLFSCVLLVYLTIGSNPYVIVLKIKNATSQSNLLNFSIRIFLYMVISKSKKKVSI